MTLFRTLAVGLALGHALPAMAFTWESCDVGATESFFSSIDLRPWQLDASGTLMFKYEVRTAISSTDGFRIEVDHRVDGRKLPCLEPLIGSCTYNDVCSLLTATADCPVSNSNCDCPFSPGTYSINPPGEDVQPIAHAELLLGSNQVRIQGYTNADRYVSCTDITFEVRRCEEPACQDGEDCEPRYCLE